MNDEFELALPETELEESEDTAEFVEEPTPTETEPETVTLRNRTDRAVILLDPESRGIHVGPREVVELPADRMSQDINRQAAIGLIELL